MSADLSVRIWYENLAAMPQNERLPLTSLTLDAHIHGGLRLQIGGRMVPYLGYFNDNDVCFGQWLEELWMAAQAFESAPCARYVFDEGEQGQPAFLFEREVDRAYFSIVASELSEGEADPDWQRVEFSRAEFLTEHTRFRERFFSELRSVAPGAADGWIHKHDPKVRHF